MKTKYKVLIHLIFWFYIINQSLFSRFITATEVEVPYFYEDVFWSSFLNMISFYSVYFCIPFLIRYKNKLVSVVLSLLLIAACTGVRLPIDFSFWKYVIHLPEKELVIQPAWVWNELRMVIITGIYSVLIYITINWFETQKLKSELLNEKQTSELALLRSQLNPHFLFNTLNNIYSLVYKKSDDAPEAVMKLSSIMRYTLYDSNTDKVLLEKEIEFLKSFIELQLLRLKTENFVEFNIKGDLEGVTIPPMLFISFVENAFKHGNKKIDAPGIIINLVVDSNKINLEVKNYCKVPNLQNMDLVGGIGLQNIKRRLDLLYKDKHKLEILQQDSMFIVKLEINNS
jgi:two-component system, LytTR family, sensor kinase